MGRSPAASRDLRYAGPRCATIFAPGDKTPPNFGDVLTFGRSTFDVSTS